MKEDLYTINGEPECVLHLDEIKRIMKSKGCDKIIIQELIPDKQEKDDYCFSKGLYVNSNGDKPICEDCKIFKKLKGNVEGCDDLIHVSFKEGSKIVLLDDGSMIKFSDIKN